MSGYPNYPPQVPQGGSPYSSSPYPPEGGGFMPTPFGGQNQPGYPPNVSQTQPGFPPSMSQSQPGYPPSMPTSQPGYAGMPGMAMGAGYPGQMQPQGYPGQTFPGAMPQQQNYPAPQMGQQQPVYYPGPQQPSGMSGYSSGYPNQMQTGGSPNPYHQPQTGGAQQGGTMSSSSGGTETYSLSVSCKKLKDKDIFSKSDPVCIVSQQVDVNWQEIGRSEQLKNNLNPSWQKKFIVDKKPGQQVRLKFEVYDWDAESNKLKKQDFLAKLEVSLDSILSAPGQSYTHLGGKEGQFFITAERVSSDKNVAKIQFSGRNLDKKDTFGKSDPFFVISKMTGMGKLTPIVQSEVIPNSQSPRWNPFSMSVRRLCNGDYNSTLKIEVFDHDGNNKHDLIGYVNTNLKELSEAMAQNKVFFLINPKKQGKKNYRNSGEIFVSDFALWESPAFQDPY